MDYLKTLIILSHIKYVSIALHLVNTGQPRGDPELSTYLICIEPYLQISTRHNRTKRDVQHHEAKPRAKAILTTPNV